MMKLAIWDFVPKKFYFKSEKKNKKLLRIKKIKNGFLKNCKKLFMKIVYFSCRMYRNKKINDNFFGT